MGFAEWPTEETDEPHNTNHLTGYPIGLLPQLQQGLECCTIMCDLSQPLEERRERKLGHREQMPSESTSHCGLVFYQSTESKKFAAEDLWLLCCRSRYFGP
jgi:hypothetical protein